MLKTVLTTTARGHSGPPSVIFPLNYSRRVPLAAFAGLLVLTLALTAQDTQRTATFSSNTNLVVIDVYARDKSGKPITTLTKDDFVILEDGKPQVISVFELQHLDTELLPPIEDAPRTLVDRTKPAPP